MKGREIDTSIFHPLTHSPNAHKPPQLASLTPGAQNPPWVFHVSDGDPATTCRIRSKTGLQCNLCNIPNNSFCVTCLSPMLAFLMLYFKAQTFEMMARSGLLPGPLWLLVLWVSFLRNHYLMQQASVSFWQFFGLSGSLIHIEVVHGAK